MNLKQAFENYDEETIALDDISTYGIGETLNKLRNADNPDFESHIESIDNAVEEFEQQFEDFKEALEFIRVVLIEGETDEDDDEGV